MVGIIAFLVGGEPKSADEPVREIVDFYDNKDSVEAGAIIAALASLMLIFFGAYLRQVLRDAAGEGEILSLVSFVGLVLVALGFAIDGTISFALAEEADDINPIAVQALQALWDNNFVPIMLGVFAFLWATGLSVIRSGVVPKWLGWALLGILAGTPIGFAAIVGSAVMVLVLSNLLSLRARSRPAAA